MTQIPNLNTKLELLHSLLTRQCALRLLETENADLISLLDEKYYDITIRDCIEDLCRMGDDAYHIQYVNLRDFLLG